jgi:hypothetical protein
MRLIILKLFIFVLTPDSRTSQNRVILEFWAMRPPAADRGDLGARLSCVFSWNHA